MDNFIKLVHSEINVEEIISSVSSEKCGATSLFIGTTREDFEGKKVVHLEYEAYEPMAIAEMNKICDLIREKWDVHKIGIVHRLGVVPLKQSSIVIAISSEHRKESLEALQFSIDTLKASVPIWKKEVYANEDKNLPQWKSNAECSWKET